MKQQSVNIAFTRDEIFWLKSMCVFHSDPKRCTQPLQAITEKVNGAFLRLDRKKREIVAKENQMPLIEYIEGGGMAS